MNSFTLLAAGVSGLAAIVGGTYLAVSHLFRTTPISPIHPGKRDTRFRMFDLKEVRRPRRHAGPVIRLSDVSPSDPRVAELLAALKVGDIEPLLRDLSGENDVQVDGKPQKIRNRSTRGKQVFWALDYVEKFFRSLGLSTERVDYLKSGKKCQDLIAEKKGAVHPEKVLIFGAHIDSTCGNPRSAEDVAPGADDDASGVVALMAMARILCQLKLGCTVRFAVFTGEEQGLWGSYVYSDKVAQEKNIEVIGMIQLDMIGYRTKGKKRCDIHDEANRNGSHKLVELMLENVARYKLQLEPEDTHNMAVANMSDHAGFLDHGYMAVVVSEEFTEEGFNPHYHSEKDRVAAMSLEYMLEIIRMCAATGVDLLGLQ
jgi:hypothetical protein